MTTANLKLNDKENESTMQDPGVTLLKLNASEQACSHSKLEADSSPYSVALFSVHCVCNFYHSV